MPAKGYLLEIRTAKASEILHLTDMRRTDIDFAGDFSDANYFARAFKQLKSISPTEYRLVKGQR